MKKATEAKDREGQLVRKGDVVATLSDNISAKICDICEDLGEYFVRLRPVHQPFGRGVWHSAEHVVRLRSITK